jgi:glycosyltransferase involved in cell wall biosynthesis
MDRLAFPPRNGITIPAFHFLNGLKENHEVSLLWLRYPYMPLNAKAVEENRKYVENLWVLDMQSVSSFKAASLELSRQRPYFAACATINPDQCTSLLRGYDCDVIWATPITPFAQVPAIENCLPADRKRLRIAAINDTYTSTLRASGRRVFATKWHPSWRIKHVLQWLRSFGMAHMEHQILCGAHRILVQSERDKEWIELISKGTISDRVVVLSNGVNASLFNYPYTYKKLAVFGHIGSIAESSHARTMRWVLDDVFPRVRRVIPQARFKVLGQEGSPLNMSRIKETEGVEYFSRVENMGDFYQTLSALLVWNYKHQGLINRTIEAMAAGVVVIGEPGAFNGINGFRHRVHGLIAEDTEQTNEHLIEVLSNKSVRESIAQQARSLVQNHFRWADRIRRANSLIKESG